MQALSSRLITIGVLSCCLLGAIIPRPETAFGKRLYTYQDEQGTVVITDHYDRIPPQYRSQATIRNDDDRAMVEGRLPDAVADLGKRAFHSIGRQAIEIPGLSRYQSQILTYTGILSVICLAAMKLSRSQFVRFLSLWCLILVGIVTPVLLYVSQDGPADIMRSKASQIQDKQLEHLKAAP